MNTVPTPEVVTDESPLTLAGHRLDELSELLSRRPDLDTVPFVGAVIAGSVRESA